MNYKELLESRKSIYRVTSRWKHFKNAVISERYFSNYLSHQKNPNLEDLQADLAYLKQEQLVYSRDYAFLFFAENEELSTSIRDFLMAQAFSLSKHLVFTNHVDNISFQFSMWWESTLSPWKSVI